MRSSSEPLLSWQNWCLYLGDIISTLYSYHLPLFGHRKFLFRYFGNETFSRCCFRTLTILWANIFFLSTFGYPFSSVEEIFVLLGCLPRVFFLSLVLPGASLRSPVARFVTDSRDIQFAKSLFRGFPLETKSSTASLQLRVFFHEIKHFTCFHVLTRVFMSPTVFLSFFPCLKNVFYFFLFRFSSTLPGASSAADAQPGSIVFLIDPTPYRVLRCNPTSDSLMVFPGTGSKKSVFFALKSTVWTPLKILQSLAINTERTDC